MRKIHQLPEQLIAQIAAGEVIERPVYVVKELVENAIDAHADTIIIHIEEAGLKKIISIDNGEGMNEEDLTESFKPHSTSKIISEDQLHRIETLGFRGEALSSIAAVSQLRIQSRQQSSTEGKYIEIKAGQVDQSGTLGIPTGTSVIVSNLFYTTPARKKFLKTHKTEFRHIVDVMTKYIFAYPFVHFTLTHNGKTILDATKNMDLQERIKIMLGLNISASLLPISYQENYIHIEGFLSKPQTTTSNAQKNYIFINKRAVTNKLISQAIKDAYGTLLEPHAYPIFILFLELPYDIVDVNVHPRKEEIRFMNNQMIYDAIYKAVRETLGQNNLIFQNQQWKSEIISPRFGYTDSFAAEVLKEKSLSWDSRNITTIIPSADIQQIHDLYMLTQTKYGLLLIDQHAAHERILYEEFLQEFQKQKKQAMYSLPKAVTFELSLGESELLQDNLRLFEQLGFEIEHFQKNIFFLNAIPVIFKDRDNVKLLTEILEDIAQEKNVKDLDRVSAKMIAYLACRSAVKAGDRLTKKQCKEILEKLQKTPNKATCPHGRPTMVEIDLPRINKLFKR
jgi:DNA mismatch repair protein MutL